MSEDERYRTSTQYKLWSYTPQSLTTLRSATNGVAAEKVKAAIQRAREAEPGNGDVSDVECLTVEEELKLVAFYCRQLLQLGDHLQVPTEVKVSSLYHTFLISTAKLILSCTGNGSSVPQALLSY
jgi:cyclin H